MYQIDLTNTIEKKMLPKGKKICNSLDIGEKVLVLAKMIKIKNQLLENFISKPFKTYHISAQKTMFTITGNKKNIDKKNLLLVKKTFTRKIPKNSTICIN